MMRETLERVRQQGLGLIESEKADHANPEEILASVAEKEQKILLVAQKHLTTTRQPHIGDKQAQRLAQYFHVPAAFLLMEPKEVTHTRVASTQLSPSFFSSRMDNKNCNGVHPYYKNDWLQFCLK